MKKLLLTVLILHLIYAICTKKLNDVECLTPYCSCQTNDTNEGLQLICDNFTRFEQLDFTNTKQNFSVFKFIPLESVILDDKLNLTSLTLMGLVDFYFDNINTIDVYSNPFKMFKRKNDSIVTFTIQNSNVSFIYQKPTANDEGIFSYLNFVGIFNFINLEFLNGMPAFMFNNTKTSFMNFANTNFNGAFSKSNSNNSEENIDIMVYQLQLSSSKDAFNSLDMNWNVFKNLVKIALYNTSISYIHDNFSIDYKFVYEISCSLSVNLNQSWINSLNKGIYYDLDKFNIEDFNRKIVRWIEIYDDDKYFSNDNFCMFKDFPFKQLIIPTRYVMSSNDRNPKSVCTCTIYWLYQYHKRYQILYQANLYPGDALTKACLDVKDFDARIEKCNFEQRLKQCNGTHLNNSVILKFNYIYLISFFIYKFS